MGPKVVLHMLARVVKRNDLGFLVVMVGSSKLMTERIKYFALVQAKPWVVDAMDPLEICGRACIVLDLTHDQDNIPSVPK